MLKKIKIGIIGGSGLNNPDIFEDSQEQKMLNEFGNPSDKLILGKIGGVDCVLLARHGRKHTIPPSLVNYRANLLALKELGCTHVIVSTACGSLRGDIEPGDFVIIDSFIDRTTRREQTYFDGSSENFKGILHIPMEPAFCPRTREILLDSCRELGHKVHEKGTMVTIEGPRFSSRAESRMYRQWGGDVVNMSTVPEVVLARELGLCYGSIAMATDYDCWKDDREGVSVDLVLKTFKSNAKTVVDVLKLAVSKIAKEDWTETVIEMKKAIENGIM